MPYNFSPPGFWNASWDVAKYVPAIAIGGFLGHETFQAVDAVQQYMGITNGDIRNIFDLVSGLGAFYLSSRAVHDGIEDTEHRYYENRLRARRTFRQEVGADIPFVNAVNAATATPVPPAVAPPAPQLPQVPPRYIGGV